MDPKQPTLDPKLQEVYDRVMGTPTGAPQTPPPADAQAPVTPSAQSAMTSPGVISAPTVEPTTIPVAPPPQAAQPVVSSAPVVEPTPPPPPAQSEPAPAQSEPVLPMEPAPATPSASPTEAVVGFSADGAKAASGKKLPVSMPILLMGIVVFFVVYALFWMKIFNVFLGA